jgi:hypothetical protein
MGEGPARGRPLSSILPNSLEMLKRIANFRFPDQVRAEKLTADEWVEKRYKELEARERREPSIPNLDGCIPQTAQHKFTIEARNATKNFWPELWEDEGQALEVLRQMRILLRAFWKAADKRSRGWYIHQARAYHRRFMIQRERKAELQQVQNELLTADGKDQRERAFASLSWLYAEFDQMLFAAPAENPIERALFKLQERAEKPSMAPRVCNNPECPRPYFFANKKSRRYCSPECAHEGAKASKRDSWDRHKEEWRTK